MAATKGKQATNRIWLILDKDPAGLIDYRAVDSHRPIGSSRAARRPLVLAPRDEQLAEVNVIAPVQQLTAPPVWAGQGGGLAGNVSKCSSWQCVFS